jgi:hypothetical protein
MRFLLFTIVAVLALSVANARADSPETVPCTLAPASSAAQARIQATCVRVSTTFGRRADDRDESYRVRVDGNACERVEGSTYRCRAHGFIGDIGCRAVVRASGLSRRPARLEVRLTYFACAS